MSDELTTQEVAQELGYNIKYVRQLLRRGIIHGRQFNRVWIIDREEVERIKTLRGERIRLPKQRRDKPIK
jgi:hypothetical protein